MTTVMHLNSQDKAAIVRSAVRIIKSGGVILAPFDTVYGLICDPRNERAITKIFDLKQRPADRTLGVAMANVEMMHDFAINQFEDYIREKTPGRYTFIVSTSKKSLSAHCYRKDTIGIRIPNNQLILKISDKYGGPIAQTSANKSGQPNCFSLDDIRKQFSKIELESIDLIIDGGSIPTGKPSTLIDLTGDIPKKIER